MRAHTSTTAAANMPDRSSQQWMRTSLRTPGILIFGMVLAPCGWIFDLVATVAPSWRTLNNLPNNPPDKFIEQGIWDICIGSTLSSTLSCGQSDTTYFNNQIIPIARGLMVASLIVTLIGLAVAIPGVRCWRDNPNWVVAGLGGVLLFLSGVMTIIPIAWYTHILKSVTTVSSTTDVRVGYCIVLGYIGGIFEILAGIVMFIGICRCCGGKNRGEKRVNTVTARYVHEMPPSRPTEVPRAPRVSRTRSPPSSTSSVSYPRDYVDDDVSFPRAKTPPRRVEHTSYNRRPYDVDL